MKTEPKNTYPLGYVELPDGAKPIYPMNDIFLNYTFKNETHWETLRLLINLLIDTYAQYKPDTKIKPVVGSINVETQYKYLLNTQNATRDQDIKLMDDKGESTYIEFQNRGNPSVPIELRSVEYFGLGIAHSKGKLANQIWILAEDVEPLLRGNAFARYILKDEITGDEHPKTSGILYISLTKLSQEKSHAGEFALFLLGRINEVDSEIVKRIANSFSASFNEFKSDQEVAGMLSFRERVLEEGIAEGRAEGAAELLELIKKGLSPEEAFRIFTEGQHEIAEAN